jgi:hypothetical protein
MIPVSLKKGPDAALKGRGGEPRWSRSKNDHELKKRF